MTTSPDDRAGRINRDSRLHALFAKGKYLSIKHDSYFQVYERIFGRFVGQPITFVEVGVLNGGSLFMWRDYFGPQARIIGVDLNPGARRWQEHGFEIHIGSQSDPDFWARFFAEVGEIDVLLDDGGHTNRQQIVTVDAALNHVRPSGLIVVEDTHASYLASYWNPSARSFIGYCKHVVDSIGSRSGQLPQAGNGLWQRVFSVEFYESIVVFNVDPARCFVAQLEYNQGETVNAKDFRYEGEHPRIARIDEATRFLNRIILLKSIKRRLLKLARWVAAQFDAVRLGRYFR